MSPWWLGSKDRDESPSGESQQSTEQSAAVEPAGPESAEDGQPLGEEAGRQARRRRGGRRGRRGPKPVHVSLQQPAPPEPTSRRQGRAQRGEEEESERSNALEAAAASAAVDSPAPGAPEAPASEAAGGKIAQEHRPSQPELPSTLPVETRAEVKVEPSAEEPTGRNLSFSFPTLPALAEVRERKIAMFCDLENLALGVRDSDLKRLDVGLLLERLLEKGKIVVKRAYADWERYSEYKRPFHEAAVELIDIPQKFYSGKNSADIKLVVDAIDLCYAKDHLDTFVIVSGDSDFSPLVSKLKENDKYVIGIGVKSSSSNLLIDNCDEFIYYEDMWRDVQKTPRLDHLSTKDAEVFALMIDAIVALVRENKEVLWGSMIKQTMKRKRPSFSEGYYGYASFTALLQDAEAKRVVKLTRDRRSGGYVVTGFASPAASLPAE